ncbi:unnamed protein product [Closterium sp. NIES-53]
MAAQELRWLTYLLTDLGDAPRSPPVLYANTTDVFTKALQPCDHQPCFAFLDWSCDPFLSPTFLWGPSPVVCMLARLGCGERQTADGSEGLGFKSRSVHLEHPTTGGCQRDSVSLFDHTSGAAPAPPTTADTATRSQWLTRNAALCLAIRKNLPLAKCAHFGQHRTAKALYDAVVARYSSPATTALGRLLLPYLFPELSAFATVEDLVSHLRTSDPRYRAALPAEFLEKNPPSMDITLYVIVTRLLDSLRVVKDHFLALDPTALTVDLLEQHLLAAETSVVAVGAARGTPRTPFFEGCSPFPLAHSYACAAVDDVPGAEDVGAASASAKHRSSKGKGGKGGGGGSRGGGGGSSGGGGGSGGGGSGGSGGGSGGFGDSGGGSGGSGSSGSGGSSGGWTGAQRGGSGGGQRQQQQRRSETSLPQQLCEWLFQRGASGGCVRCPYVIRTGDRADQTCGKSHTQHRCFSCLDDAWRAEFGDEAERPRWAELLRTGVAIFDLDYDAILAAMYALSVSAEGDCYLCVPPDPGIEAAALGASESVLPGTAPTEALHTFTHDSAPPRGRPGGLLRHGELSRGGLHYARSGGAELGVEESEGAGSGGAEPWGAEPGGAQPARVEPGGITSGGAELRGTASSGGPAGAPPRMSPRPEPLSPQRLHEWLAQRTHLRSGGTGAEDSAVGDTGAGGAGVTTEASGTGGAAAAGPGGARTGGTGAAGTGGVGGAGAGDPMEPGAAGSGGARAVGAGVGGTGAGGAGVGGAGAVGAGAGDTGAGGAGAGGAGAVDPGAGGAGVGGAGGTGAGGTVRPRPYFVPLLWQVLGVPSSTGLTPILLCPPPDQSQPPL